MLIDHIQKQDEIVNTQLQLASSVIDTLKIIPGKGITQTGGTQPYSSSQPINTQPYSSSQPINTQPYSSSQPINTQPYSSTQPFSSSQPINTQPQSPYIDQFAQREKEAMMNQLIEDCYKYICLEKDHFNTVDPYNIRSSTAQNLLDRLRPLLSSSSLQVSSLRWSTTDSLLLLQKLVQTEYDTKKLQEKHSMLLENMMKTENQRDDLMKENQKVKEELNICQGQVTQYKYDLQRKETEVKEWKDLAMKNGGKSIGSSIPYQAPIQPTPTYLYFNNNWNIINRNDFSDDGVNEILARVKSKLSRL